VLDLPLYSIHPNAVPRDQIVSMLVDQVNSGNVRITLGEVTITPSLRIRSNNTCPTTCVKEEESDGLTTGPAVGLGAVMLVIGIIIGIVSAFLTMWVIRRGKLASYNASAYSKQKDDAVI